MNNLQPLSDKTAISLSLICTLHCLALPLAVIMLPSLAILPLENEAFHWSIVLIVIPISIYALTMGCKKHRRYGILLTGGIGLLVLIAAVLFGEALGEVMEKSLTVLGSAIIAFGHFRNYYWCRQKDCECPQQNKLAEN